MTIYPIRKFVDQYCAGMEPTIARHVFQLLEFNEDKIAAEDLCSLIYETQFELSDAGKTELLAIAKSMELDVRYYDWLAQ